MKKVISLILTIVISISAFPIVALAEDSEPAIEQYNEIVREYDSQKTFLESIVLDKQTDILHLNGAKTSQQVGLTEKNDTAMVSLDSLCKFIDAEYTNDTLDEIGYSTISYENRTIWFNEKTGAINVQSPEDDNIVVLDETPYQENDSTMVPLEQFADALGYETYEEDGSYLLTRPYQTCRLLVSTKKRSIDTQDAIISVRDEKNDITILQFENEVDAIEAEEYYSSLDYTVEPDCVMSTNSTDEMETAGFWLESKGNHRSEDDSDLIHVDDMNDYLAKQKLNDVIVGVIDTGVCSTHPDLQGRVICADVNFSDSEQENSEDDQGHGTHVSGIIADNTLDNVKVLAVKALSADGKGSDYQIYCAMMYAVEQGAKVLNLSLGRYGKSDLLTQTVLDLCQRNISVVCAAGNNSWFARDFTPAGIPECITVTAINSLDRRKPGFANWDWPIDTVAPGVDVYSTYIFNEEYDGYRYASGTSMASPFVAAAVIMMYSYDNSYTSEYVHERVRESYLDKYTYFGYDYWGNPWGYGIIDCSKLIDVDRVETPTSNIELVDDWNQPIENWRDIGFYNDYVDVELYCEDEGAEIYYTTDGTRATKENGALYTGSFRLETSARVHAVAYLEGKEKSIQAIFDFYVVTLQDESAFEIDKNGYITTYYPEKLTSLTIRIPDTINGVAVKGVAKRAFYESKLYAIYLPETCEIIEQRAFDSCGKLQCIKGVGVKEIKFKAFYGCTDCEAIDMPNVENIEQYSFYSCLKLKNYVYTKLKDIPDYAFYDCGFYSIDFSNIEKIGKYAFYSTSRLVDIKIDHPIYIDDYAFKSSSVENIHMENIGYLGSHIFERCFDLISVDMPDFDGEIPEYTFNECKNLTDINIPNVKVIDVGAFFNCQQLKEVAFNNAKTVGQAFDGCVNLEKVQFDSAERIGRIATTKMNVASFPNCKSFGGVKSENLIGVYLPNCTQVTGEIVSDALQVVYLPSCTYLANGIKSHNLKEVYLPKLESFGMSDEDVLFEECYSLEEYDLPSLVNVKGRLFGSKKSGSSEIGMYSCKRMYFYKLLENEEYAGKTFVTRAGYVRFDENLPDESSEETLSIDFSCVNPRFEWFYSETGEENSFSLIENATDYSYSPQKDGYYFIRMHYQKYRRTQERIEQDEYYGVTYYFDSNVCHYTYKEKEAAPVQTHTLSITSPKKFSVTVDGVKKSASLGVLEYKYEKSVPDGATVVVSYGDNDFESWICESNRVVSNNREFEFSMAADTTLTANQKKSSVLSSTVSFYNANGDFISSGKFGKYSKFTSDNLPAEPSMYAHTFIGWDKTVDEINNELSKGNNVIVTAQYERDINYKLLYVLEGEVVDTDSDSDNGKNYYRQLSYVTVRARVHPGLQFWYWIDNDTGIVSYDQTYTFYITADTKLTAVYGFGNVTPKAITNIKGCFENENKISFVSERYTPIDCTVLEHGILLTSDKNMSDDDIVFGTYGVLKGKSTKNTNNGTYIVTKGNITSRQTWRARSYTIYRTPDLKIHTLYSPVFTQPKPDV